MNRSLKTLYKLNPKSLKAIHDTFRIDFNKPLEAVTISGNTTIKQILKKVNNDSLIIVLTKVPGYYGDRYRAAVIDKYEKVKVGNDKYSHYNFIWQSGIDSYYGVGVFREAIKDAAGKTIVIAQESQYLCEIKKHSIDFSNRYVLIPPKYESEYYTYMSQGQGRYISNINLKDINSTGKRIEYKTEYYNMKTENILDIIDKSGYIVENKRIDLKRRSRLLKEQREKAAYTSTNNTERIAALGNILTSKKDLLAAELKAATTYEQVKTIEKKLDTWKGLSHAYSLYEDIKRNDEAKSFKSIDSFEYYYKELVDLLNSI